MANTTYNWQLYMAKIIEMYFDGGLFPKFILPFKIRKMDLRQIYGFLKKHKYPTKPKEREAFLQQCRAQSTSIYNERHLGSSTRPTVTLPSNVTPQSVYSGSDSVSTVDDHGIPFAVDLHSDPWRQGLKNKTHLNDNPSQLPVTDHDSWLDEEPYGFLSWLLDKTTPTECIDEVGTQYEFLSPAPATCLSESINQPAYQVCHFADGDGIVVQQDSLDNNQTPAIGSHDFLPAHSSRTWPYRSPSKTRTPAYNTATIPIRATSLPPSRFGSGRSFSSDRWMSESTRDSGYSSGRNSPVVLLDERKSSEQSLQEFRHLYRVPCRLHEPELTTSPKSVSQERPSKDQYKNVTTCSICLYSAIHNLSWSSKYLKLEVFQSELKLDFYQITAIDAVGNSALHYAAAGANSDYLISLMQAGVNPYRLNTEGQLFFHYLHPNDDIVQMIINPVNTLNYLNRMNSDATSASLRWRDNEGRKFLDTIAAHMADHDMKSQLVRLVNSAGYQVMLSEQYSDNSDQTRLEKGFSFTQERQQKAYEILGRALSDRPNYVDPETGDNVLHALAKLNLPERGSVLQKVADFASKAVDLNLHNRDRHSPLAAFIEERPCLGPDSEETGATLSKYLDALLWKDTRCRIPNRINVNMRNRAGATALYYAAIRGRPDSVRSLIEAGANVNACITAHGYLQSILQATLNARSQYVTGSVKMHLYNEVVSYLQHEGAVADPEISQQRALCLNSVRAMPI